MKAMMMKSTTATSGDRDGDGVVKKTALTPNK